MTKFELAKKTVSFIVGAGTGTISGGIIHNNVVPKNTYQEVTVACASFAIGSMATVATKNHTEAMIDEAYDAFKNLRNN